MTETTVKMDFEGREVTFTGDPEDRYFRNVREIFRTTNFKTIAEALLPVDAGYLDIGANIGMTTLIAGCVASEGRIVCFEPSPATCEHLRQNVRLNNLPATVENVAVGAEAGELQFLERANGSAANHVVDDKHMLTNLNSLRSVPVISVDEYVAQHKFRRIDLIKIDVEGFELPVLQGMKQTLKDFSPIVVMEFNSWVLLAHADLSPRQFLQHIRDMGIHVYHAAKGVFKPLRTDMDYFQALHENIVINGCVTDLILSVNSLDSYFQPGKKIEMVGG